jgi:flagellar hook-associated protein 1 FlgK
MSTSLLSLGTRAMFANYAALQTTGNNISNASTPGYSRQQVELASAGGQQTGAGFFGRGVDVASVTRSHDAFLTREATTSRAISSGDATRQTQLERLEQLFGTGEAGLGYAAGELLNAFVDVASKPQDLSARQVVLGRADELAARFRDAGGQLDALQAGVAGDLKSAVASINSLAQRIAQVNDQIAKVSGSGQPPNDLLDQRDSLIGQLADFVQVTTVPADDGSVNVFVAGGQRLVLGANAAQFAAVADPYDPSRLHVAMQDGSAQRILPDASFGGGSVAGLLRFQGEDLVSARNLLGQMASALASSVNQQQSFGLDLKQPAASGGPMFALGAAQALPASTNTGASSVSLSVTDARQLQASDYELRPDPSGAAGSYQLTRLSDGKVSLIASGDTVDGMRIDVAAPAPAAADRFLLRPVGNALGGMQRVLDDPRGIAAASPVTATLGAGNTGTASVAALGVTSSAYDPALKASIAFTSAGGDYDWELRDAGNAVVASGSATWSAGQPITLNGFALQLDGVPASGDSIAIERTAYPAANNGNALALAALREQKMVGLQSVGTQLVGGESITDAYASALASVGVRVQGAKAAADTSHGVAAAAESARANSAGVNLDEEAARLMQYQQSYQAAAKVLQVAQSIFDSLLEATR